MQKAAAKQRSLLYSITKMISLFTFSDKLKFALKASLSIAMVYIISFSLGWEQAQTAAITIMLIAAAGPVSESVLKGLRRAAGTTAGAIIGMILIGLFPQDRELYLVLLSVFVTAALYFTRAYRGDTTVFMLTALTMMMVFKNGEVDDVFIYGLNRTFMTVFGIAIYSLVAVSVWPVKKRENVLNAASELLSIQSDIYARRNDMGDAGDTLYAQLQKQETLLESIAAYPVSETAALSRAQRNTVLRNLKNISEILMLLSYHKESGLDIAESCIKNYSRADSDIKELFSALGRSIDEGVEIGIPDEWKEEYDPDRIETLPHIERAALASAVENIKNLHKELRILAERFNAVASPHPTRFELEKNSALSRFVWLDIEDLKGTAVSFLIFWTTTIFWIVFNPPAGFLIVTLATSLSILTTNSPLKPSLLIILFSFSFVFAAVAYIAVLPNIHYGWELGVFIFLYAFIGFYFINPKISVFFLLGLAILGLGNPMRYDIQIFLMTLLVFYLFLFVLLLFYYIPFSTKPEVLFLTLKKRFFLLAEIVLQEGGIAAGDKMSLIQKAKFRYARRHLMGTAKKMQFWADRIDDRYFNSVDTGLLHSFCRECETFAYLCEMMYRRKHEAEKNPIMQAFIAGRGESASAGFPVDCFEKSESGKDLFCTDATEAEKSLEADLRRFFSDIKGDRYSERDIINFYKSISLTKNVRFSFVSSLKAAEDLDFNVLERSRF